MSVTSARLFLTATRNRRRRHLRSLMRLAARGLCLCFLLLVPVGCAIQPGTTFRGMRLADIGLDDRNEVRTLLVDHYRRWRGTPYRTGGMSRRGVDCSGFVVLSYDALCGLHLPRTTKDLAHAGREISATDILPGDMLLFKTGWFTRHVGIYLGDGTFLHASTTKGVIMSSLSEHYWRDCFWQARRILY